MRETAGMTDTMAEPVHGPVSNRDPQASFESGFSWIPQGGMKFITKSLAPAFVFVDVDVFNTTNVRYRLDKRDIKAYVSVTAPLGVLAHRYGWNEALRLTTRSESSDLLAQNTDTISTAIVQAVENGADAIVLCDDLCGSSGPLVAPLFVVEVLMPLYRRFAAEIASYGLPALFHSDGDVREYYPGLADGGFFGVHIAHPKRNQVEALFAAARMQDLVPYGGIIASDIVGMGAEKTARFALEMSKGGSCGLCDDGALASLDEFAVAVEAFSHCQKTG